MNYAGKFDAAISLDGGGSHSPADVHADSFTDKPFIAKAHGHVPEGAFVVPDPNLIFNGQFKRAGGDLVLSHDGHEFVVHDYFRGDKRAALSSPDGAHLTGDIVNALTGHVQYAQAASGIAAAQVIGHVTKLSGSATAIRNGVSVILNNGDNVEKGDVVSTGGDSTLGITFIDGTVFGLSSNARMVLNEMVYDPNGSNNSSLLSLVAGTITFVAGETAKHGDMKIDTPVATMGIRGTAVLSQIHFVVPAGGGDPQPEASFQVLVEPNGTTGSYILFDKVTLLPIATVNQAGQMIQISGGNVSISNALMSPDIQKLITDVFTLKFTDNNSNTKLTTNFTDSITQTGNIVVIKTDTGATATATFTNLNQPGSDGAGHNPSTSTRIPGPPDSRSLDLNGNVKTAFALTERADTTGDTVHSDTISGRITFVDQNLADLPTVSIDLGDAPNYVYKNVGQQDVTSALSALQKQDIAATQIQISVAAAAGNNNNGSAVWTYTIPDHVFDFLAAGETLTLTYKVRVNNNFSVNPETSPIDITITITGTNDKPVISTSVPTITFEGGTSVPGGPLSSDVPTSGTLSFDDVDLTDKHTVSVALTSATLPDGTVPPGPLAAFQSAMSVAIAAGADSTGDGTGTINWSLANLPVYLADFIPKGEVLTLVYTVTLTDSQGATSQQTITVTITGTDAAAVVWIATDKAGAPSGGFWKDAANWETGTVPTIDDDVIVITDQLHGLTPSYPVTIDAAAYAKSVTMNDFGGPPPEVINKSLLTIAGALNMSADSIFTNSAAGVMSVGGKAEILGTSVLTNAGYLTLAGGGDFAGGTKISNSGTIELSGGTLKTLALIHNAGGTLKADAGTTLIVDTATVDGGTVAILGTLELDGISLIENGTLNSSGAVNVKGTVEFAHETVSNTSGGTIKVLANGWLTIDQGSSVTNNGAVTVDASGKLTVNGATIDGAGTVTDNGEIDLTGNAVLSGGILQNNTAFKVSGTGNALDGEVVTNAGTIEVLANGALAIDQGSTVDNSAGSIVINDDAALALNGATISGGAINNYSLLGGTIDVTGDSRIDGNATLTKGAVTVDSDVTLTLDDATVAEATITSHGTVKVDISKKLTLSDANLKGGTLTISGTLESIGTSAIDDADITNTGTITVTSGTLTIDPATTHAITNHNLIQANGGVLDVSGEDISNTAALKAVNDGTLKLTNLTVSNSSTGSITVDGTSKLYLTVVSINGGSLSNAGNLYSAGANLVTGNVINTGGAIEVQSGTLNLSGGITGVGSLIIDNNATLELGGADAQTVTFAGGANTLKFDDTSHDFSGTIAGQASIGGLFTVTGDADINSSIGDALDFTASGGTSGNHGNIVLTPTGTLTGVANGIVVTQNGTGAISLTTTKDISGLNGNGITLRDSATGSGNITINNLTGKVIGTGANSVGILVENLNSANDGDISITQLGGVAGGAYGIDAVTQGGGDIAIHAGGTITGSSVYGIRARSYGAGSETVTTDAGSVVNSGSSGIVAVNRAMSLDSASGSSITVNAYGTISSGSSLNQSGNPPAGIQAGYSGATIGSSANTNVNGSVVVNNHANITAAAGYGIHAYNYGNGDVAVNDAAGTAIVGAEEGIRAQALSGGTGDVSVTLGADASVTGTTSYGVLAYSIDAGDISVTMASGDSITSGSSGIVAVNYATAIASSVGSTISVEAHGIIHSGSSSNNDGTIPGGIIAGYKPGGTGVFSIAVKGDVTVTSDATIIADAGYGIEAFTWGAGKLTVTTGATSSITAAAGTAIGAFDHGGGDVKVTNNGSATGTVGLAALANGSGDVTIINHGGITSTSLAGISVTQNEVGATGSTHITNTGSIVAPSAHAAIFIQENATGFAQIDNSATGTIGPAIASTVTSTTYAIVETGGAITINNTGHINGNISVAHATFHNDVHGIWTVAGTSVFGNLSSIVNDGDIDLLNGASISGSGLSIENDSHIYSRGTASISGTINNTGTIEVHDGDLTLFGSLSGTGSVTVDAGATLEVKDAVSQTITLAGNGAHLQIDTSTFGGSIAALSLADTIDLSTIVYDDGTSATYNAATGELVVSDAYNDTITLKLAAGVDYSNYHFAGGDDGHGGTLITINADDYKPVFDTVTATLTAAIPERENTTGSSALDPTPTAATGSIDFKDIDLTDRPTAEITSQSVTWFDTDGTTPLTLTGQEAALEQALTLLPQTGKNNGTVTWSYSVADSALDFLGENQTAKVVSTVTLDDHQGEKITTDITITITGKNDAPVITAETNDSAGATLPETNTGLDKTGTLTVSDVDATDHVTVAIDHASFSVDLNGVLQTHGIGGLSNTELLNYLTVQPGDILNGTATHAQFSWEFNSGSQDFDFLAAGQTLSLQYTIVPSDGHAATGTGNGVVTITINGTNDAPTLDSTTLDSVAGNDSDPSGSTISDLFANRFHDADAGATFKAIAVTSDAATAEQGVWQYELAGTHQWVDIGSVCDTTALVLSPDTLIRFVPADGYSGTPGALGVHALDDTYAGDVTTPATIDLTATGTGGTTPVSHDLTTIGTEVTAPPANGPVIDTEHFRVEHIRENSTDIITDLQVIDTDSGAATDTFTVSLSTAHPTVSSADLDPTSGSLDAINTGLATGAGITYNPTGASTDEYPAPPDTDQITLTVADSAGHYDTVNFIFVEGANSQGITLSGANGKDVIFATESSDTLIGGGAKDQFVFAPTSSQDPVQHTVNDFEINLDKIDLRQFTSITSWTQVSVLAEQQGADTLLNLDANDKILLKNTVPGNLHAGDFILHVS